MNDIIRPCAELLCMLVFSATSSFAWAQAAFDRALRNGAEARVVVSVVDDDGRPVSNATIKAFFEMGLSDGSKSYEKETDVKGIAVLEGNVSRSIHFRVEKAGYYKSHDKVCLIEMGHEYEVRDGKWQPWGMKRKILLRPIHNPCAVEVQTCAWRRTKALNEWIGFDFEKYDFVKPFGRGETCDMKVKFEWDEKFGTQHNGMTLGIRFCDDFSGAYYDDKRPNSDFVSAYAANPQKAYEQDFRYYWHPVRDSKGRKIGGEGKRFEKSKILVGRSRCKVDETGNLLSARYFQLSDLKFSCSFDGKAALYFSVIYNPTPNDTNLEPKRESMSQP